MDFLGAVLWVDVGTCAKHPKKPKLQLIQSCT